MADYTHPHIEVARYEKTITTYIVKDGEIISSDDDYEPIILREVDIRCLSCGAIRHHDNWLEVEDAMEPILDKISEYAYDLTDDGLQ